MEWSRPTGVCVLVNVFLFWVNFSHVIAETIQTAQDTSLAYPF